MWLVSRSLSALVAVPCISIWTASATRLLPGVAARVCDELQTPLSEPQTHQKRFSCEGGTINEYRWLGYLELNRKQKIQDSRYWARVGVNIFFFSLAIKAEKNAKGTSHRRGTYCLRYCLEFNFRAFHKNPIFSSIAVKLAGLTLNLPLPCYRRLRCFPLGRHSQCWPMNLPRLLEWCFVPAPSPQRSLTLQ